MTSKLPQWKKSQFFFQIMFQIQVYDKKIEGN
jgi:hypothetical protein